MFHRTMSNVFEFEYSYRTTYEGSPSEKTLAAADTKFGLLNLTSVDAPDISSVYKCEACAVKNCRECVLNKDTCSKCSKGLKILNNTCTDTCPTGMIADVNGSTLICKNCSDYFKMENCLLCSNSNTCQKCSGGMYLQFDPDTNIIYCTKKCQKGFYLPDAATLTENQDLRCQPCSEGCDLCRSANICDECSCKLNGKCYFTMITDNKVRCSTKCQGTGQFKTLDNSCISCLGLIPGCLRCTDDLINKCNDKNG